MGMCGTPIWGPISDLTTPMVTGFGPTTMAGPGYLATPGAGLPFTTAAGFTMITTAGYGNPVMNGRLPGYAGAPVAIIMAGRH